jgi:hypothetical protein
MKRLVEDNQADNAVGYHKTNLCKSRYMYMYINNTLSATSIKDEEIEHPTCYSLRKKKSRETCLFNDERWFT